MHGSLLLPAMLLLPLVGSVVLLVAGSGADRWARPFGVSVSAVVLLGATALAFGFDAGNAGALHAQFTARWVPQLGLTLTLGVDGLSIPLVLLTALLSFLCAVYTLRYLPEPGRPRAFVGVLLFLQVGMLGTFLAQNLLLFFVFFEFVLIPMWFLIDVWGSGKSRRTSANVFIYYTLTGSMIMLIGFLVLWWQAGTADFAALAQLGGGSMSHSTQLLIVVLIGLGLAVKVPMWPLHSWLPNAHTAAPTVGSVLLAGVLLKMGTYGLVRIVLPSVPQGAHAAAPYLAAFAVVGIVYGALASFGQRDLKRLIAFSSVGHMGFVLLGIATLVPIGVNGAMFGNVAHGLITGLLFFVAGGVKLRFGTTSLHDLPRGLYARAPRLGFLLGFAAIASLGLPGLAGFWGEFFALLGAYLPASSERTLFRILLVLAAVGTVFAAAYFLRVLRRVGQGNLPVPRVPDLGRDELASWLPLAALVLILGLAPALLLDVTAPVVNHLLAAGVGGLR
jgi:NADH-quinone oxidoreductase subunit M